MKKHIKKIGSGAILLCLLILGLNCTSDEEINYEKRIISHNIWGFVRHTPNVVDVRLCPGEFTC